MVDGHDSMETAENSEGPREKESRTMVESNEDGTQQTTSPTTTISTIAVQSGETRLVIALLQVRGIVPYRTNVLMFLSFFSKKKNLSSWNIFK